jgi:hypothetical protein
MGRLLDDVNAELARCAKQGGFEPCPREYPCWNCGCQRSRHWAETPKGFATGCRDCGCKVWCCPHGGQRVAVPGGAVSA